MVEEVSLRATAKSPNFKNKVTWKRTVVLVSDLFLDLYCGSTEVFSWFCEVAEFWKT